jgi:hypothetical protein
MDKDTKITTKKIIEVYKVLELITKLENIDQNPVTVNTGYQLGDSYWIMSSAQSRSSLLNPNDKNNELE